MQLTPARRTQPVRSRDQTARTQGLLDAPGAAALVVDDEAPTRDELAYLLQTFPQIRSVHAARNSNEALRLLHAHRYDVAFLDVRMPSLNGVELAYVLRRFAAPPTIVFVTAYEEYAVQAFEVQAIDYLLKPVSRARLGAALDRALGALPDEPEFPSEGEDSLPVIPVETTGRIRLIDRLQVCRVEAEGDYVRLHLVDGSTHLVRIPISHLEEKWSAYGFIRIHRSHLVPVKCITEFAAVGGNHTVVVAGQVLPVSRRHARAVRDRFLHTTDRNLAMSTESDPSLRATQPQRVMAWGHTQARLQHDMIGVGDLHGDTSYGRLLVRSLMHAQLSLSLMCLAIALTVTASFPVLAAVYPAVIRFRLLGLPLTALVLGGGLYPVLLAIGWFYHHQAGQIETRFIELVDPSEHSRPDA